MRITNSSMMNLIHYPVAQETWGNNSQVATRARSYRFHVCKSLYNHNLTAHFGCVNAVEFSHMTKDYLASGGDDKRVLLWNMSDALLKTDYKPVPMKGTHLSNIFCLAFDNQNEKLFSSGNDEQVLIHDLATQNLLNVSLRDDAIFSISTHPKDFNIFATASEDGKVHLTDLRQPSNADPTCLCSYLSAFHGVAFNPAEPNFVATAHSRQGAGLWDVRKPKSLVLQYGDPFQYDSAMSVSFNDVGTKLFVLRRRTWPKLFKTHDPVPCAIFKQSDYVNSCTMKSGCFAGENDEYVVSGSDDFSVYVWKTPKFDEVEGSTNVESSHMVLRGHRSIVNQVRYNTVTQTLASSGVEKSVKLWSPFKYPGWQGTVENESPESATRQLYSRNEYIDLVLQSGSTLNHEYESENTVEDPRMIAFFDSLLQHDMDRPLVESDEEMPGRMSMLDARDIGHSPSPEATDEQSISTQREMILDLLRERVAEESNSNSSDDDTVEAGQESSAPSSPELPSRMTQDLDAIAAQERDRTRDVQESSSHFNRRVNLNTNENSDDSSFDESSGSRTRQRNAQRKRKAKKWTMGAEKKPCLGAFDDKLSLTSQPVEDPILPCSSSTKNDTSEATAYERSAVKLYDSITKTEMKLAKLAENLVQALERSSDEYDEES